MKFEQESEQNLQTFEQLLNMYEAEHLPMSVFDIYEKAKTPHKSKSGLSMSVGGPPVGVENIKKLVQKIEQFAKYSLEKGRKEDIEDGNNALALFNIISKEKEAENPDAKKVDNAIAEFTRERIEKFSKELGQRAKAAGVEPDNQNVKNFSIPLEAIQSFDEGKKAEDFFRRKPEKEQQEIYDFLQEYPAVFLAQTLKSIEAKKGLINTKNPRAFDPMVPLSVVEEEIEKEKE